MKQGAPTPSFQSLYLQYIQNVNTFQYFLTLNTLAYISDFESFGAVIRARAFFIGTRMDSENGIAGISVDSLKIRIPIEKVEILDSLLSVENLILVNADTGEQVDAEGYDLEFRRRAKTIKESGITTRFAIEKQQTAYKTTVEYLVILFNSKLLRERYFEGITDENIDLIYEYLVEYKIASFSFTDFLSAECTDVDFKKDINYESDFSTLTKTLYGQTIESRNSGKGANRFNKKTNQGIQFSKRETTQFKTNPYLKIYHKGVELEYNSTEFRDLYLPGIDCTNRVRIEATVKNKKHFRALFGKAFNTELQSVLMLSSEQKELIFRVAAKAHLQPLIRKSRIATGMKPNTAIHLSALNIIMQKGISFELARDALIDNVQGESQRSRKRTELTNLYYDYIKGSEVDETTKEIQEFFSIIGMV